VSEEVEGILGKLRPEPAREPLPLGRHYELARSHRLRGGKIEKNDRKQGKSSRRPSISRVIPIAVMTWPDEAARTSNSACVWIAEATVDGRTYTARSRHGPANELARQLVAAGLPDRPMGHPLPWAGGDHDISLVPCRGEVDLQRRRANRCAASGTESRRKGSSCAAGRSKMRFIAGGR
jgi:hypothetical protein